MTKELLDPGTNADGTPTEFPIGEEGVDPYASDAEWIDTGGVDKGHEEDAEYVRNHS